LISLARPPPRKAIAPHRHEGLPRARKRDTGLSHCRRVVQSRIQRLLALTRADLMLLFLIIFDMSVKPSWGDVRLWIAVVMAECSLQRWFATA
jgi:hypothetical protein